MKNEYLNYNQLMNRVKELEIELKELRLAAKFDREDNKFCNFLVNNLQDILFKLNPFGKISFVNNAVKTYGYTKETLIGRDILDIVYPDDVEKVKHQMKKSRNGDTGTKNLEIRLFRGNEETFHGKTGKPQGERAPIFSISSKSIYSSNKPDKDSFLGTLGIARDITKQKKAEDDLKKSEAFLEAIIDNIPATVFVKDTRTLRFVLMNKTGEELLGYSRQEIRGKKVSDIFPEAEAALFTQGDKKVLEEKKMLDLPDVMLETQSNGGHILQTRIIPLLNDDGDPEYIIGIALDITQQRKLEAQSRQAQKMEALGTLAGGIAHDFNNILAAILGHTEMSLINVQPNSKLSSRLNKVMQAGQRAKELVNQVLTFSRQKKPEKKPIEVNSIVREALKLLRASIPSTIEFKQDIQETPAVVFCDPTQLHQVVMNLCTNAALAMEETGGRLEIRLANIEVDQDSIGQDLDLKPGPYVRLSVSDTGKGMDKNTIERIFEPYFTTQPEGKGTGLGLSVVHGIVKSLDGAIKVYSEPGKGTTFRLYFPLMETEIQRNLKTKTRIPNGTEHILLVDDEHVVLELTKEILERLGYTVTSKNNGTDALKTFRENPDTFDLLITDLTMPEMTGKELGVHVSEIRPHFPIILCTGFNTDMTQEEEFHSGIRAFINKPIHMREIAEVIRKVLDTK